MKKALFTFAILASVFTFMNFSNASANNVPAGTEIPKDVQQIINKSCVSCHNSNSTDKKAKEKLDFSKFKYLKTYQRMAKWDKIAEVAINDEMPPKKFKKKHPEKALTMNDLDVLTAWVNNMTDAPAQPTVTLDSQLENLINQIVASLAQNDKSKIAVMDFVNMDGEITKLGRYMSEELTTRLYLTGKFEVIERQLLDKIVEEQKISMSGMIDENSAVELGRVLGVDAIASGTITDLGTSVKVNARLISAESGKLFSVASVEIPKNDKVKVLLSQSVSNTATAANKTANASTNKSKTPASQTVKIEGYTFELLDAWKQGEIVTCRIIITNTTQKDKNFKLYKGRYNKHTAIYTNAGDEIVYYSARFGNTVQYPKGSSGVVKKKMVAGTSIGLEIYFNNVSSNATKIDLLYMHCDNDYNIDYMVQFRNIPLKKE